MFQIMDALSFLHHHEIAHRDIKPQNVLYDPETKKVKLIDFGISKKFKKNGELINMWTQTGTLFYRAPEMFSGDYRESVDVWAAGILLFELATGTTPFQSEYHNQTVKNIKGEKLVFPPRFN